MLCSYKVSEKVETFSLLQFGRLSHQKSTLLRKNMGGMNGERIWKGERMGWAEI